MRGVNRRYLAAYINEFVWRRNFCTKRSEAAEKVIEEIVRQYPLTPVSNNNLVNEDLARAACARAA